MFFRKNAFRNRLQHYKMELGNVLKKLDPNAESLKVQNKKADLASQQSFPASDPPGHISTSEEDKIVHH